MEEIRFLRGVAHRYDVVQHKWIPVINKVEPNNMSYKLYLGQSVVLVDEPAVPKSAIYLGKSGDGKLVVLYEQPKADNSTGTPIELWLDDEKHLRYIKIADKKSPSGKQIYHGSLCKFFMADKKLKKPEEAVVMKEFAAIKMLK